MKVLVENGTFEMKKISTLTEGTRLFVSRFVDELKRAEVGMRRKLRLVTPNYAGRGASEILTKAPTVKRIVATSGYAFGSIHDSRGGIYTGHNSGVCSI